MNNIETVIVNSNSMREAALKLNIPFSTFKRKAVKLGLYKPNQSGKGICKNIESNRQIALDIIEGKVNPPITSTHLKNKLLKYNLIEPVCNKCGNDGIWNNETLILQLDHIDGNSRNNLKDNLRLLCPNCHSQTKTYCRSSNTNNRVNYDELETIVNEHNPKTMSELLQLLGITSAKLNYRTVNKKLIENNINTIFKQRCLNCDKPISGKGKTGYCNKCSRVVQYRVAHPSKSELIQLLSTHSLIEIGKQYKVSDNAVRKWLKKENLPYRKKDINKFIHGEASQ